MSSIVDTPGAPAPKAASGAVSVLRERDTLLVVAQGDWLMGTVADFDERIREIALDGSSVLKVDTSQVTAMDTAGAWLIERLRRRAEDAGLTFEFADDKAVGSALISVLHEHEQHVPTTTRERRNIPFVLLPFHQVGRGLVQFSRDFTLACHLLGASIRGSQMKEGGKSALRLTSIVAQVDNMGRKAVPVIGVMSLLIGGILAQQSAYQLKFYGEELLAIDLVGILLLREIGVLLTAIMVAGRTGSAITAEIGTMKQREEVDALHVMGLNPVGVLILPRLLALLIALPILTLLADFAGLLGAMIVLDLYVGVTPGQFLEAFRLGVGIEPFFVGLIKAPVMALIIGLVAAIEGLKVGGSAESLGQRTTASVVRAIFAVIFIDGLFAIFFASIGF